MSALLVKVFFFFVVSTSCKRFCRFLRVCVSVCCKGSYPFSSQYKDVQLFYVFEKVNDYARAECGMCLTFSGQ